LKNPKECPVIAISRRERSNLAFSSETTRLLRRFTPRKDGPKDFSIDSNYKTGLSCRKSVVRHPQQSRL